MRRKPIEFITMAEVIEIHKNQIRLYGGEGGIRDISLLSSALAMPMATFDGRYLCGDLFAMAAAYGFHICQNHPFVDGNKRVALVTALMFLDFNGIEIDDPEEELYRIMMDVSMGKKKKMDLENVLRKLAVS